MKISSFVIILAMGIIILVCPNYLNTDSFIFNFSKFLKDNPYLTYPCGIIFIIFGIAGIACTFIGVYHKNTAYIINETFSNEFGQTNLFFPKFYLGSRDANHYVNLATTSSTSCGILNLEKEHIKKFYDSIKDKKRLAILSISIFPFLVYAGFCIGQSGKKIIYFHYNRSKNKAYKLKRSLKPTLNMNEEPFVDRNCTEEVVVCVSTSYKIDKTIVQNQFHNCNIYYLSSSRIGINEIKNKNDLEFISDYVRTKLSSFTGKVNLLLSCSASLCFSIGTKLSTPGLPKIIVYNFNNKEKTKWNWHIEIN